MFSKIILVSGLPGSGKSYLASRLSEEIGAVYISSDILRKKLISNVTYSEEEKVSIYEVMLDRMEEAIQNKKDVVLDATFYKKSLREIFLNRIKMYKARKYLIEVLASETLIRKRLSQKRDDSDADWNIYEKIRSEFEPIVEEHLLLESEEDNIQSMITDSLAYIHE